jgi:DNA polymerase V
MPQPPPDPIAFRHLPPPPAARRDDPLSALDLHRHLVPRPGSTFFLRAGGDGLAGCGVCPGDLLIIDRSRTPQDGDLVIAIVAGDLCARQWLAGDPPQLAAVAIDGTVRCEPIGDQAPLLWGVITAQVRELVAAGH